MLRPTPRKKKLSREEKTQQTFENLMAAAARVVGEEGYAATSIAKITQEAGVSHGTFYNYFEDRQALFDMLLPHVGQQMTQQIIEGVPRELAGAEREIARFAAYCRFLEDNPGFYRILYEAEVFAPAAHEEHIERLVRGYRQSLDRAVAAGDITGYSSEELDDIVAILLGARAYIAMRYKKSGKVSDTAMEAYARLMREGLFSD